MGRVLAVFLVLLAACDEGPPAAGSAVPEPGPGGPAADAIPAGGPDEAPIGDAARGGELVERFECNRCHEGTGLPAVAVERDCVGCHQQILAGTFEAPPDVLQRWQEHIRSLPDAPSLAAAGARLRPSWIAGYLTAPRDLRPHLIANMPRLALDEDDARDLAAYLTRDATPERGQVPDARRVEEGRRLLGERGCTLCHAFTGAQAPPPGPLPVELPAPALERAMRLAPDLRFTRDRFRPDRLVDWILDPAALKPGTPMPKIPVTRNEAEALASAILHLQLAPSPPPAIPARLPVLQRPVAFDEVRERVFRKLCWHCHSDPTFALGDGGPGNTGGLGFQGRRIDLAEYPAVMSGYVAPDGRRHSLFEDAGDGVPRLVATLLARQREEAGDPVPGIRGMPLGFPSLPPGDIQLIETWIAQGRPQ